MFSRKFWNVLIVDDEPDIHEVTKLTLKKEDFWGAKLKLYHANSATEAMELLRNEPALTRTLAVALIDVVMETDHAGLDLCRFMRDECRRQSMQLILRTGQPGQAPPRTIIDELNISGYLTKLEAAGDRLYMEVKSAIQTYYDAALTETWALMMDVFREKCSSPDEVADALKTFVSQDFGYGNELHIAYDFFGNRYVGGGQFADKSAYDSIIGDLLARAQKDLETSPTKSYYGGSKYIGSNKGIAVEVPNRVAQVDDYVIVQTRAIGMPRDKFTTLVMRNPTYPRRLLWFYGPAWRSHLAWLAEVMRD